MSFSFYDTRGYLADGPSTEGAADLLAWAQGAEVEELVQFLESGQTKEIAELVEAIQDLEASEELVESSRSALVTTAQSAQGVLILSDGLSVDDGKEVETATEPPAQIASNDEQAYVIEIAEQAERFIQDGCSELFDAHRADCAEVIGSMDGTDDAEEILEALEPVVQNLDEALALLLEVELLRCSQIGGRTVVHGSSLRAAAKKSKPFSVSFGFKGDTKDAVKWAKKHAAESVTKIGETTRKRLRAAVVFALETHSFEEGYERILDAIGNRARAKRIAQYETMQAVSAGRREAWSQAIEQGYLDTSARRAWIATIGACERCKDLDGKTASLKGSYPGGVIGPPDHGGCRCTEGIVAA